MAHGPQLRAVCLMDTHTHLIRAASFGDYRTGELSFAAPLMQAVPDASLTIFDRAYFSRPSCSIGKKPAAKGIG